MNEERAQKANLALVREIERAYKAGEEDESLEPIIGVDSSGRPVGRFEDGDYVIFYDIRGEREVELTKSLTEKDFRCFPIKKNLQLNFVTMIEYDTSLKARVAFPADGKIKNTLAEVISAAGLKMVKIVESEKAVHVGYFMNGKSNKVFPGEERVIIPSPRVISSNDLKPEMRAIEVAEEILSRIKNPTYRVIIANLANVDVIGHIENREAILKAVEVVDSQLGKIMAVCRKQGITLVVTSDHGTVEEWFYDDGSMNTGHTRNPVPFIVADFSLKDPKHWIIREQGELSDVAPTVLELLGIAKPVEMTGESLLLNFQKEPGPKKRVVLVILDGWGLNEKKEGNLIAEAKTLNFDRLWSRFPHSHLQAAGDAVGMPSNTVGNSEAGHLHLGAGRRVLLDRVRIDKAIEDGSFFQNKAFIWAMEGAKKQNKALHLLGIVSHYSSHGTIKHLFELLRLAANLKLKKVFVHALIGRRGEKPESGAIYVATVEEMCKALSTGQIVTVIGRFWALDREENWDRVEKAYRALVFGEGNKVLF